MGKESAKQEVRRKIQQRLRSLDEEFCLEQSLKLGSQLSTKVEGFAEERPILVLAWIPSFLAEPQIDIFIEEQLSKRDVYVPVMTDCATMTFVRLSQGWQERLTQGILGNLEPVFERDLELNLSNAATTVVLVPGIAFDRSGNRLGRGKGCYDTFLSNPKVSRWTRVGVCWSFQVLESVPTEDHDLKVDYICTENEWIEVERNL